jgi:hypothetical protein
VGFREWEFVSGVREWFFFVLIKYEKKQTLVIFKNSLNLPPFFRSFFFTPLIDGYSSVFRRSVVFFDLKKGGKFREF